MTTYHKHHIVPKHMGGTDDPSNLLRVNIPMHAFLHGQLYKEHGKQEDLIASRMLSGQISAQEATKLAQSQGGKKRVQQLIEEGFYSSDNQSRRANIWNSSEAGKAHTASIHSSGGTATAKIMNSRRVTCDNCGMTSTPGPMARHIKKCKDTVL